MSFKFNFPDTNEVAETPKEQTSLKFNFPNSNENADTPENSTSEFVKTDENDSKNDCTCIDPLLLDTDYLNAVKKTYKTINVGTLAIKYITSSVALEMKRELSQNSMLFIAENNHSDLLPGVYEGGFKLWECAIDLTKYLNEQNNLPPKCQVLELGCGVGLPGIFAFLQDCFVTFQDFNSEVLELTTIPSVILNASNNANVTKNCKFISGDWGKIQKAYFKSNVEKFDVILTSETIYETANHQKLLNLMKSALNPHGIIYLAAKMHYFGVGGSLDEFKQLVEKDNVLSYKLLHTLTESVPRSIVEMKFKQ